MDGKDKVLDLSNHVVESKAARPPARCELLVLGIVTGGDW